MGKGDGGRGQRASSGIFKGNGKGKGPKGPKSDAGEWRQGDWICDCGYQNFAWRSVCRGCGYRWGGGSNASSRNQDAKPITEDQGPCPPDTGGSKESPDGNKKIREAAKKEPAELAEISAAAGPRAEQCLSYWERKAAAPDATGVPATALGSSKDWIPQCNLGKKLTQQRTKIRKTQDGIDEIMRRVTLEFAEMAKLEEQLAAQQAKAAELEEELLSQQARPFGKPVAESVLQHVAMAIRSTEGQSDWKDFAESLEALLAKAKEAKQKEDEEAAAKKRQEESKPDAGGGQSGDASGPGAMRAAFEAHVLQASTAGGVTLPEGWADKLVGSLLSSLATAGVACGSTVEASGGGSGAGGAETPKPPKQAGPAASAKASAGSSGSGGVGGASGKGSGTKGAGGKGATRGAKRPAHLAEPGEDEHDPISTSDMELCG